MFYASIQELVMNSDPTVSDAVPKKKKKEDLCLRELLHKHKSVKKHRNKAILASMTDGESCTHIHPALHSCWCCRKGDFQGSENHKFILFFCLHVEGLWKSQICIICHGLIGMVSVDPSTYLNLLLWNSRHQGHGKHCPALPPYVSPWPITLDRAG